MKRPKVELENFEEVYEFYERHEQSQVFARFAHFALARVYRPDVTCDEGVQETIHDELRSGSRLILSPNHLTSDDHYIIASLAEKFDSLHSLRGNTFIPSKPLFFNCPGFKGKLQRRLFDGLGALPAFRLEDLHRQGVEITDEIDQIYQQSIIRASEAQVAKIVRGSHMAGFWEGTRNMTDHRVVQQLKKGIGYTAIVASNDVRVLLLPVGMYYGGEPTDYQKQDVPDKYIPQIHVGMPIPVETTKTDELVTLLHPAIQGCVDVAVARAA
jgi:hypothetical protein